MILVILVACEIGFWVFLIAGLVARYVFRRGRTSAVLLVMAPLVDVVLLAATAINLHDGGTADWSHGLAALYIGFSVAYGHRLIQWADARFAHRFAGGAAPRRLTGAEYARVCWADAGRTAVAVIVAAAILGALIWWVGDSGRTQALMAMFPSLGIIETVFVLWAVSYTIWPRKPKAVRGQL